jgi:putative transposon-encoded protein
MTKCTLCDLDSENLVCKHCNQEIEICTDLCGTKLCGEEWVHSKTKKHECDYIVKHSDELVMSGKVLNDFKRIVVAETLEIKPNNLFTGKVVKSGNGASISFKKKFIGREVYVIVKD